MAVSATEAIGTAPTLARTPAGQTAFDLALVFLVALGVRLALWPLATIELADSVSRVWIAWRWLSDPTLITHGVWGPLHFYLMAPALWWFQDPIAPPVAVHIAVASLTPIVVYLFTRHEFGGRRASLIVALVFALYPVAVRTSLQTLSEAPFILFLAICLLFLARARGPRGRALDALIAGLSLTLACMLRYEGWMLIPFLAVLLWRRPRLMLMFTGMALIHPIFWMIGNQINSGDPFYGFNWASHYERIAQGRSVRPIGARDRSVLELAWFTVKGMIPLLAIPIALGAGLAVVHRSRQALWLLPCGGLFVLLVIGCLRAAFKPGIYYTITFGLFLIPYLAELLNRIRLERLNRSWFALLTVAGVASLLLVSVSDSLRSMPVVRWIVGVSPVPGFPEQDAAIRLVDLIAPQIRAPDDGLVSDFYGWLPSYYVALLTHLHPDRIFLASGVKNEASDPAALGIFLDQHPQGVLLLLAGSRFCGAFGFEGDRASVEGRVLSLVKVANVPWPPPELPTLPAASPCGQEGPAIFRYQRR
jgi:Dolichyl-phosphate-mannose-protein mannosyltransferase